jgi:hypothetical protein
MENFPTTNTLAYFATASVTKKKRFIAQTDGFILLGGIISLHGHMLSLIKL